MSTVSTTKGELSLADLDVAEIVTASEDAHVVATEYRLDGEIVRRDVHVTALRGVSDQFIQGAL